MSPNWIILFKDLVVLCSFRYCFSLTTHVALASTHRKMKRKKYIVGRPGNLLYTYTSLLIISRHIGIKVPIEVHHLCISHLNLGIKIVQKCAGFCLICDQCFVSVCWQTNVNHHSQKSNEKHGVFPCSRMCQLIRCARAHGVNLLLLYKYEITTSIVHEQQEMNRTCRLFLTWILVNISKFTCSWHFEAWCLVRHNHCIYDRAAKNVCKN